MIFPFDLIEMISASPLARSNKFYSMMLLESPGGGFEGPTYWDYGSRYNVFFIDALENSLGTDFGLGSMVGFRRSGDFQIHLSATNLMCFNFSDSDIKAMSTPQHFWMGKSTTNRIILGSGIWHLKEV